MTEKLTLFYLCYMITLIRTDSSNSAYQSLVKILDAELKVRDGDDHAFYAQYNKSDAIKHVVLAYVNNLAVACGALKKYEGKTVEVKRMFVRPEFRGQGIAAMVLKELESWANESGFETLILETGINQPEAINLYKKWDYLVIPNYGQYEGKEMSICMTKILTKP